MYFQGLLKAINLLEGFYGNIYIRIGEEISLKQFCEQYNDVPSSLQPLANTIVNR